MRVDAMGARRAVRLVTLLLVFGACASRARAQGVAVRLGVGPAVAGTVGRAGLLSLEGRGRALIVRAEGRAVVVTSRLEAGLVGIAVGVARGARTSPHRPYLLATYARGLDVREADPVAALGAVLGVERAGTMGSFVELRYEHAWQPVKGGGAYYRVPRNWVTLVAGLRLGAS